jgi:hypothetical protein
VVTAAKRRQRKELVPGNLVYCFLLGAAEKYGFPGKVRPGI